MNSEQWMGLARQIMPVVGTVLASLGFIKPASVVTFTDIAMQAIGALMVLSSIVWSLWSKTQTNQVAQVAALAEDPTSPVKGIITTNDAAGRKLASSIPSPTVVPAGSVQATEIAKPGV